MIGGWGREGGVWSWSGSERTIETGLFVGDVQGEGLRSAVNCKVVEDVSSGIGVFHGDDGPVRVASVLDVELVGPSQSDACQ